MRKNQVLFATLAIGAAALLAPIALSCYLASQAGHQAAVAELGRLASDVQRRSAATRAQIDSAVGALNADRSQAPCSPAQLQNMNHLVAGASHLQGLGFIQNDTLVCSTLNTVQRPVVLGPPDHVKKDGSRSWNAVTLPTIPGIEFNISDTKGYAAIIAPDLVADTLGADARISLAQIGTASGALFRTRGLFKPAWVLRYQGDATSFSDGDYLVDIHPSDDGEVAALAAMPLSQVDEYVTQALKDNAPFGALAGAILSLAVGLVARRRLSARPMLHSAQLQACAPPPLSKAA